MPVAYFLLALIAGMGLPLQVGFNSILAKASSTLWACTISCIVGTFAMICVVLLNRAPLPNFQAASAMPTYAWFGGLIGVFYITTTILAAPKTGAATLVALVVTGQLIAAIALDHIGFASFPQHSMSVGRLIGVGCLILGVILVKKY